MAQSALLVGAALLLAACGSGAAPSDAGAAATAPPVAPPSAAPRDEHPAATDRSNPLGLPPAKVTLDAGKRVFTFTEQMMAAARLGATLVLSAATVAGIEGDDLIIEARDRPSYKVHPGYVIPVPDTPKIRLGDAVLTEQNGLMKHAVILRFGKERVAVRYTDVGGHPAEAMLPLPLPKPDKSEKGPKAARFVRQVDGLAPGNYAALREGDAWLHVLLVSASGEGDARRWFALGFGGAARIVAEADLRPIPVRFRPKLGKPVWAEWSGKMRRATVQSLDEPGLFTVKYERAGRPAVVGWGLLMAPLDEGRPPAAPD